MFLKRLISGIFLLIAAAVLFYVGGTLLLIVTFLISLLGQTELYKAIGIDHKGISAIGYAMTAVYYLIIFFEGWEYVTEMIVVALMVFMAAYVITFPEYKTDEISGAFFGMCYVSVLMSYIYLTRMHADGKYTVWLILISSWGCDTLAYCTGMLLGKHKMTPKLSPKKSWEGAIGGVLGAGLLGIAYGAFMASRMDYILNPVWSCFVACMVGAVISIIGDLAASAIKRNHGIKDFGHCIPGHGGILDRFDSMLFTAPSIYYALILVSQLAQEID